MNRENRCNKSFREDSAVELLKERILKDGVCIGSDILKVDSFLNHQIDITLFNQIGEEFKRRFAKEQVTKILTIEASGIAVACITAQYFDNVPVVFAKKQESSNLSADVYSSEVYSFTKNKTFQIRVDRAYLAPGDSVLIIDDFLANGNAALGLADIVEQSGAKVAGLGIVIEKGFQDGRQRLLERGYHLESLAVIQSIADGQITFA